MIRMKLVERSDWRTMLRIETKYVKGAEEATRESKDFFIKEMKNSWSKKSPSTAGKPPAKVSGNLDNSIVAENQGRNSGKFGGSSGSTWFIKVDTAHSTDGRNQQYAEALEFGAPTINLAPRPFMQPAYERTREFHIKGLKRRLG